MCSGLLWVFWAVEGGVRSGWVWMLDRTLTVPPLGSYPKRSPGMVSSRPFKVKTLSHSLSYLSDPIGLPSQVFGSLPPLTWNLFRYCGCLVLGRVVHSFTSGRHRANLLQEHLDPGEWAVFTLWMDNFPQRSMNWCGIIRVRWQWYFPETL